MDDLEKLWWQDIKDQQEEKHTDTYNLISRYAEEIATARQGNYVPINFGYRGGQETLGGMIYAPYIPLQVAQA
jgi:hypothetical protein